MQTRRVAAILTLLMTCAFSTQGQTKDRDTDRWAEYVAGDYNVLSNITYSTANNTDLKLDLYLPKDRSFPKTTLIFFHGGGWVEGRKESAALYLLPYISFGWAVINVEYRLGRNSLAPAAVVDCRCALRWATDHARQYNLDPSRFVLTGSSAGGHLALITGMLPAGSAFDHQCPTVDSIRWNGASESELNVAAVINWFGITDVADLLEGPNAKHYAVEWFGAERNRKELAREVSPMTYVRAGLPPIITIHGDSDDIVPYGQAVALHKALSKSGVPNQLLTIKGGKHGGFTRQQTLDSFDVIREFLSKNGLLNQPQR
ncbi:MAG TPA: alpha/beta hydrolase [Bacteroidota bacterium]